MVESGQKTIARTEKGEQDMTRNRKESDAAVIYAPPIVETNGVEAPAPSDPTPNGEQPVPQPAQTPKRKTRNPDSVRPIYMLAGQERGSSALRVLMVRPTIGQARKAMADAQQMGGRDYEGYVIFRCKAVS